MADEKPRAVEDKTIRVSIFDCEVEPKKELLIYDTGHRKDAKIRRSLWSRPYGFYLKAHIEYKGGDYELSVMMKKRGDAIRTTQ